jgi:hypothetical protein
MKWLSRVWRGVSKIFPGRMVDWMFGSDEKRKKRREKKGKEKKKYALSGKWSN